MIPQHPHIRRYFAQPRALHVEAKANVKAWLVGRSSIFVVMRTYHKGFENHPNTQVMFFKRFGSCPQVLARWSGPEKAAFLKDTEVTFKQCNATDFPWPELGPPVILTYEQLMKVYGRWMQPLRKKEGKRTTKKPYLKVKRVVVPRNDSVNLSTLYPGCEVVSAKLVGINKGQTMVPVRQLPLAKTRGVARDYSTGGVKFFVSLCNKAVRFREKKNQWRLSMSSEDRDITTFTVLVTIRKEPSDGNV
jgi:hypothetical protein